jgi:hypothetical protein
MKTESVFIFVIDGKPKAKATIRVDGIGSVEIESALSDELANRIISECETALRIRLGQVIGSKAEGAE